MPNVSIGMIISQKTHINPGPNLLNMGIKPGFANKTLLLNEPDEEVAEYLRIQAEKFHKSDTQVINDLVHEKPAVAV